MIPHQHNSQDKLQRAATNTKLRSNHLRSFVSVTAGRSRDLSLRVHTMFFVRQIYRFIHLQHNTTSRCGRQYFISLSPWRNVLLPLWTCVIREQMELVLSHTVPSFLCCLEEKYKVSLLTARPLPYCESGTVQVHNAIILRSLTLIWQLPSSSRKLNYRPLWPWFPAHEINGELYK